MKYLNILVLLIINTIITSAQINLVLNPSFEEIDSCLDLDNRVYRAIIWDSLRNGGGGSSDLFNECCLFGYACGVPLNWNNKGFQYPKTGSGYAGIITTTDFTNGTQLREYIQGKLSIQLNVGNSYCIRFYVSLSNRSKYSCASIGAYIDNGQIQSLNSVAPNPYVTPQVLNNFGAINDTLNWVLIEGNFIATGTEEYITIGNFYPDSLSGAILLYPSAVFSASYYYIDDVSVIDISTPAFAGNDTTITAGDSIYLGRPSEIGLDEACVWFLNCIPIDTVAGIMVAPDSTTTYILQQTICGNVQYDSVTVTVDKGTGISTLNKKDHFEVYPNPSNGEMYISYSLQNNEKAKILIQDVVGREIVVYQLTEDQNKLLIQENNFKNGVYFISLIVDGKLELTKKAIILK
jgi:hypothetical protein